MKVLIAEDDHLTRQGLAEVLDSEGYHVIQADNGATALELYESETPDFVCLDIMMPQLNGYDVCQHIRRRNPDTPIIFISAKSEEIDKVVGLELGADDFIIKPFGVKEVVARIRAVTRRYRLTHQQEGEQAKTTEFQMGDLTISPLELQATRGETIIELSLRDIKILELLHQRQGQVLERRTIFQFCWGESFWPNSRTLDQHISQLRKRIELDPKTPQLIQTVHGAGYRYKGEQPS